MKNHCGLSAAYNITVMERLSYLKTSAAGLTRLGALLLCLATIACSGLVYDGEGDCSITYRVKFRYDWNMKFADAFAHEVESVTLYLLDENGQVVWQRTEAGEALAAEDYAMIVDAQPGTYDLLAWCGSTDKASFAIPDASVRDGLTCTMRREHDADGAFVRDDLDRLYHGYLARQVFGDTEGVYTYTMPLMKDTNNVRVVLQHLSGEMLDKELFAFTITDDNGKMDWDNSLLDDERIEYRAWHVDAGQAEFDYDPSSRAASTFTAVVAELTVPRLTIENRSTARLAVRNTESGKTVLSIRLIDALLLVKGYYNREMSDQEYLDRQDDYSLIFFIDEGYRWSDANIYINSWKVVYKDIEL